MRILLIYCHPCEDSLTAAIRDVVLGALGRGDHEIRLVDLYAEGFDPVMGPAERRGYHDPGENEKPVQAHIEHLRWAEGLIFVYPTWWFGLPAMLKGWLDRVWVPHATFRMPDERHAVRPVLDQIRLVAAVSTCGAPWWLLKFVGDPGRRTLLRGMASICGRPCRRLWLAHYKIDTSTAASRKAFLEKVGRTFEKL